MPSMYSCITGSVSYQVEVSTSQRLSKQYPETQIPLYLNSSNNFLVYIPYSWLTETMMDLFSGIILHMVITTGSLLR